MLKLKNFQILQNSGAIPIWESSLQKKPWYYA